MKFHFCGERLIVCNTFFRMSNFSPSELSLSNLLATCICQYFTFQIIVCSLFRRPTLLTSSTSVHTRPNRHVMSCESRVNSVRHGAHCAHHVPSAQLPTNYPVPTAFITFQNHPEHSSGFLE